jgi:SAM-dependent methyltransferase
MAAQSSGAYEYDALFFNYIEEGAIRSARVIVPILLDALGCRSVLDVGCGAGAWLSVYRDLGVDDVMGVDGEYVDRDRLLVAPDRFRPTDVSQPFDLGRRFDLVQCLEVGEHLPTQTSRALVANLTRHASRVLFSAAIPGQGGEHHINEQTYEFWRALFAERGFAPYDYVRPRIQRNAGVERWYAYNTILYVQEDTASTLPEQVQRARIPDATPIPSVAPALFRLRTALFRPFPVSMVSRIAVLKHRVVLARQSAQSAGSGGTR